MKGDRLGDQHRLVVLLCHMFLSTLFVLFRRKGEFNILTIDVVLLLYINPLLGFYVVPEPPNT